MFVCRITRSRFRNVGVGWLQEVTVVVVAGKVPPRESNYVAQLNDDE